MLDEMFPKNTILINGENIMQRFQVLMTDTYSLGLPEPKINKVDIPGSGSIDLTEALFGDVAYSNRAQEFNFLILGPHEDYSKLLSRIVNYIHGREFDYQLTMDMPYTYHGRFTVEENQHTPGYYLCLTSEDIAGSFTLKVDAEPWKLREKKLYSLNACGGKEYIFESGRKKVHPVVEVQQPTTFIWKNTVIEVPTGTFRLNDVLFEEGNNELYINSFRMLTTIWDELNLDGENQMTWTEASNYRWDKLANLHQVGDVTFQSWDDLIYQTYDDLSEKTWEDLNYKPDGVSGRVYVSYDIEEL